MSDAVEVLRKIISAIGNGSATVHYEDKKYLKEALLTLEEKERYKVFVADLQERIWLHEAREPSSYILSDLRIFFKQRLKELKLNE